MYQLNVCDIYKHHFMNLGQRDKVCISFLTGSLLFECV